MSSVMACTSCRRSKMKCIGYDNPPCMRCAKVGRECVRQQYTRNRPGIRAHETPPTSKPEPQPWSRSYVPDLNPALQPRSRSPDDGSYPSEALREWPPKDSILPSIYSTPPVVSIVEQATPPDLISSVVSKRRKVEVHPSDDPVFHRDMIRMIEFAGKRLLIYIPILPAEEVSHPEKLIREKTHLANCVCFVAAKFLPGGNAMRDRLLPSISGLLHSKFPTSRGGDEDEIARLQALVVLYVFRPATTAPQYEDITHWRLKSIVEAYAVHIGCHRAISELRTLIASQAPEIPSSRCYKKYYIWLWLFTMSQHISLVAGTPPSISEDATIKLAPEILSNIKGKSDAETRLLGEVELCMLWTKASLKDRGFAEWWCQVEIADSETAVAVLNDVDALFEAWSSKWLPWIARDPGGGVLQFHLAFAKFCMATYSTRNLKLLDSQLPPQHQVFVRRSVIAAATFIRLLTDMDPFTKEERVRYLADFGFVMVSFCCQFIIRACDAFGFGMPDIVDHLDPVKDAALLMKEVAIDSNHAPALYSSLISQGLGKLRKELPPVEYEEEPIESRTPMFDIPFSWETELMLMDPLWEFPVFLGDTPLDPGV